MKEDVVEWQIMQLIYRCDYSTLTDWMNSKAKIECSDHLPISNEN